MLNVIIWIIIILFLIIAISIIFNKFPILANIDIESMTREKQAKIKNTIVVNKLKRNFRIFSDGLLKLLKPFASLINNLFSKFYKKIANLKDVYSEESISSNIDSQEKIDYLFTEARELLNQKKFFEAENKYIEIISLDSQNIKAFQALGEVYFNKESFQESRQTFEHLVVLIEKTREKDKSLNNLELAKAYFNLSLTFEALNNYKKAISNLKRALRIEKNNPKYLDKIIEISIINKDRIEALDAYITLKKVNPENNKLEEFKEKIDALN